MKKIKNIEFQFVFVFWRIQLVIFRLSLIYRCILWRIMIDSIWNIFPDLSLSNCQALPIIIIKITRYSKPPSTEPYYTLWINTCGAKCYAFVRNNRYRIESERENEIEGKKKKTESVGFVVQSVFCCVVFIFFAQNVIVHTLQLCANDVIRQLSSTLNQCTLGDLYVMKKKRWTKFNVNYQIFLCLFFLNQMELVDFCVHRNEIEQNSNWRGIVDRTIRIKLVDKLRYSS